jgi:hypothetical protein
MREYLRKVINNVKYAVSDTLFNADVNYIECVLQS